MPCLRDPEQRQQRRLSEHVLHELDTPNRRLCTRGTTMGETTDIGRPKLLGCTSLSAIRRDPAETCCAAGTYRQTFCACVSDRSVPNKSRRNNPTASELGTKSAELRIPLAADSRKVGPTRGQSVGTRRHLWKGQTDQGGGALSALRFIITGSNALTQISGLKIFITKSKRVCSSEGCLSLASSLLRRRLRSAHQAHPLQRLPPSGRWRLCSVPLVQVH